MSSGLLYVFTEDNAIAIYDMDKPVEFKCHNCYQIIYDVLPSTSHQNWLHLQNAK